MKITKSKLRLEVPSGKKITEIQTEIRDNLARMGVNGISIDIRYDVRTNIAMLRFDFNKKLYEMIVNNQSDVRANLYAIARRVEYKARLHLLAIEPFDISVSPYLAIENKTGIRPDAFELPKAPPHAYAVLGVPEYVSLLEIEKRYKELVKTFHPDNALSTGAKLEFEKRMAEINQAIEEIRKERGAS